jgi:hypothetical protein
MQQITKLADDRGFQISKENRPKINKWIKGEMIEKVKQHRILGLIFDSRMTWNEHILYAKAKAEKNEPNQLIKIHRMIILSTLRYGEDACICLYITKG